MNPVAPIPMSRKPIIKYHRLVHDFSNHANAPFFHRLAALFVDGTISAAANQFTTSILNSLIGKSDSLVSTLTYLTVNLAILYFIFLDPMLRGITPGKRLLKIRVVHDNGNPVFTLKQVIWRESICKLVSIGVMGLGFVLSVFNKKGKTLHDYLSGTRVVKDDELD